VGVLRLFDQGLEFVYSLLVTTRDVHVLHLEAQVPLRYQSVTARVDLSLELWVKFDSKLLRFLLLVTKHLHALQNCLVLVYVLDALHEIDNIELLLKLEVGDLGCIKQLHIDISLRVLDCNQNLVESSVVIGFDGFGKLLLLPLDLRVDVVAEADWSFLL